MPYDRDHVVLEAEQVTNFPNDTRKFGLEAFRENLQVKIWRVSRDEMEFDLVGLDASLANAFRRILIADIPTMAIETVFMMNNTGVIQDEVLAQRLGLVPIYADPSAFTFKTANQAPTDVNTIVFDLQVRCTRKPNPGPGETDPDKLYQHHSVYSGDLKWSPKGDQAEKFADDPIRPVHSDILLAKLRPGQEIHCEVHCQMGMGREHAKWSPVATASYRLLPHIVLKRPITGDQAERLQACFPEGVIDIVEEDGKRVAKVANPRRDTVSREVLRHDEFKDLVELKRVRNHFIFKIESSGIIPSSTLFSQSIKHLMHKVKVVMKAVEAMENSMVEE
ncbi:DNA-directed RNA polymerase core subunit rpc40 [Tieghemiomyces parasiticus]|uniref:DNA-directed RNA polymerases I and III subunit RPAC1 n=1 Tax=Tieghemiomyces parasiticus TaxID=78921 RepID=A0A9W7ZWE9_9FUNG|nr:DNA-directed RNA polymerase core subunit rpc40 [Tieghemiomyces parasiticus]